MCAVSSCDSKAPYSVVLLGDSITYGVISGDSDGVATPYAELLAVKLGSDFRGINIACSGASSLDWTLSRGDARCGHQGEQPAILYLARARPALPADLVIVMLGGNDAGGFLEDSPVEPATYIAAIQEIVSNLLADRASRVMLIPAPQNFAGRPPVQNKLRQYHRKVLALCAQTVSIACGPDLFKLLVPHDFSQDVHPNAAGHRRIAEILAPAIAEARSSAGRPAGGTGS